MSGCRPRLTPATLLVRALHHSAREAGCRIEIIAASERPWASATFNGTHHVIRIVASATPAAAPWLAGLSEQEWSIRGQLVADCTVTPIESTGADQTIAVAFLLIVDS